MKDSKSTAYDGIIDWTRVRKELELNIKFHHKQGPLRLVP